MNSIYTKKQTIAVSMCDASGRLGISNAFALFQDAASEHAELLGLGGEAMQAQHAFWMTVRTKVHFYRRPKMLRELKLTTWPLKAGSIRCDRCYRLSSGDEAYIEGRTEWCVYDTEAGTVRALADIFPAELEYCEEKTLPAPYARLRHNFTDEDIALRYAVLPSDIDIGRHMNNVAYLRMLLNSFSVEAAEQMNVEEMEILFLTPCFEGETLDVLRRKTDYGYEFGVRKPDGKYAALARLAAKA